MSSKTVSLFLVVSIALSLVVQNEAFVPNSRMFQNGKRDKMSVALACKEQQTLIRDFCDAVLPCPRTSKRTDDFILREDW
ncbi:hypothetical protein ACROYT_G011168 [Oculina patagonica]